MPVNRLTVRALMKLQWTASQKNEKIERALDESQITLSRISSQLAESEQLLCTLLRVLTARKASDRVDALTNLRDYLIANGEISQIAGEVPIQSWVALMVKQLTDIMDQINGLPTTMKETSIVFASGVTTDGMEQTTDNTTGRTQSLPSTPQDP